MNRKFGRLKDTLGFVQIGLSALVTIGILGLILYYILLKGIPNISWGFLTTGFDSEYHGIADILLTTIFIIGITLVIAVPIGVFAAIYLSEYAKQGRIVRIIRFSIESLAGIPSIIYGLFGYIFFVLLLGLKFSLLSGGFTLSILVLPTIIRSTEEALKTVPKSYKEASLALGASRLYTLFKITLPSALSGIMSSVILSVGRIVGESAAVFMTAGMVYRLPGSIMDSGRTLAVHMFASANEGFSFDETWATAAVLVILVAIINLAARLLTRILSKKFSMGKG
ncbi:MAG: phosphate ABC transporter permease PstA [Clostridia bacterium]|jgi:phosphate transport system permease protein|nr:phosphate ABC transporter permease PstA [Clostridia bacterium]